MRTPISWPIHLDLQITALLRPFGLTLTNADEIAHCVRKLSDFFINSPLGTTPYSAEWGQIAYAAYYYPLNYLRACAVVREGARVDFFAGLRQCVDFGSGPGSFSLALEDASDGLSSEHSLQPWKTITSIEHSQVAQAMHRHLVQLNCGPHPNHMKQTEHRWLNNIESKAIKDAHSTLVSFSYSLTELETLPTWAKIAEALVIMEPATSQDGRALMKLREELIREGYSIWAPCIHAKPCPLLHQSKRDWCHDRTPWAMPEWFKKVDDLLPFKNGTLAFSYLMARKKKNATQNTGIGRLVGDQMREKGSTRQMICRSDQREFIAWQHKHGEPEIFSRGELVRYRPEITKKANELRPQPGDIELFEKAETTLSKQLN